MPSDANLVLQTSTTKTATFNGTAIDLKTGTGPRGLVCRLTYSAANTSAGAGAVTLRLTDSTDNSTFGGIVGQPAESVLTLSTTALAATVYIPFITHKRYVRLEVSAISGTGATITYQAEVLPAAHRV